MSTNPKLRPIRTQPVIQYGQRALALQDPLQLSNQVVILPYHLAPLLSLCDGTRDIDMLRASLAVRGGVYLTPHEVEQIIRRLDEALLLDNERSARACQQALNEYHAAPYRRPALAGLSYPDNPNVLRQYFDQLVRRAAQETAVTSEVRAVISPHIDYHRGGPVYAQTWAQVAPALPEIDLAVIFGTDHNGSPGRITLTRQRYASPFGALPTDLAVVDALAEAIGPEAAFAEELHHRNEHSVELAVNWLHYFLGDRQVPVVPILCGSIDHYIQRGGDPETDPVLTATVDTLREVTADRRVLWVAAADLAHVGPAFGDPQPLDLVMRARLQAADEAILQAIEAGDPQAFYHAIRAEGDQWRVCGLTPIYLTLRMVTPAQGRIIAYERCPADVENGSVVTIAGALLT
ncbi:MAG: AmmeMemoRadiSam system protein B [Chloroflexi bacterium]|nr:AmmeMemoRadiSam system protein B [Chloroflexota bacterium]